MSYIVPRDKPKRCTQPRCRFMDRDTLDCRLQDKSWESFEEQYEHCPLIEVPTPHGRLIDADKLEKGFKRAIGTYLPKDPTRHMSVADGGECRGWTQALTAVLEAKTVIKAED